MDLGGSEGRRVLTFALMIRQERTPEGGSQWSIQNENRGINPADVILITETWLEQHKLAYKKKFLPQS